MKKMLYRCSAVIMSFILILATFTPAMAAETETLVIEGFNIEFVSGATETADGWVYDVSPSEYLPTHGFVYRANYAVSGEGELDPGSFVITLPTEMFNDRDGKPSTLYDVAVPHKYEIEESNTQVNFVYEETDGGIRIYNRLPISSAQRGNIEFAYFPSKAPINYVDMQLHAGVSGDLTITKNGNTYHESSSSHGVALNTSVRISYTEKKTPEIYSGWQASWGLEEPEDADDYYYLAWPIHTRLSVVNQYYDFRLDDVFREVDADIVGYKFQNTTRYVKSNTVEKQNSIDRHDFVLTRHKKSTYQQLDAFTLNNTVTAVVIPGDGIDDSTSARSGAVYSEVKSVYVPPGGQFWAVKDGITTNDELTEFKAREINEISGLRYYTDVYGYSNTYSSDPEGDVFDPNNISKLKLTYENYDNEFYLAYNTSGSKRLSSEDYDIKSVTVGAYQYGASFDEQSQSHYIDRNKTFSDLVEVYVLTEGSEDYIKVADYNHQTKTFTSVNFTYVKSINGETLNFYNGIDGCGTKLTTAAYYALVSMVPSVTIYPTENVIGAMHTENSVEYLTNVSNSKVGRTYNGESQTYVTFNRAGHDKLRPVYKESEIEHNITSAQNNKIKKQYEVNWTVSMAEAEMLDKQTTLGLTKQQGGTFYILLPYGSGFAQNSVTVTDDNGEISSSYYSVSTELNYKDSGRTLLKVEIRQAGYNYVVNYGTVNTWESIKDLGAILQSDAAYETGNTSIANGSPDDGGGLPYMAGLDPDAQGKKFLYAEGLFSLVTLTASDTGLTKKTQSATDEAPSYSTVVHQNSTYMYQMRVANDILTECKDIIIYDSLENHMANSRRSDWHGTFSGVDTGTLIEKDINPIVYYSAIENLDIVTHCDLNAVENGARVWVPASQFGDVSNAKAVAIDCSKTTSGEDYVLQPNESLSANIFLTSPQTVDDPSNQNPEAYNGVFMYQTVVAEDGGTNSGLIHQEYTTVAFRSVSDIKLKKVSSADRSHSIEGVTFNLVGTSFYGTEYNVCVTSDVNGDVTFKDIERGSYTITEIEGVPDYLVDYNAIGVTVNPDGTFTILDKELDGDRVIIENPPRIHGSLEFLKMEKYGKVSARLKGAEFALYGTSDYGNDIFLTAAAGDDGVVRFPDIEMGKDYTLVETKFPENMMHKEVKYSVTCNDKGFVSIKGLELDSFGYYEIPNEPYCDFTLYKVDSENKSVSLEGAEFKLTRADSGTPYERTATTNANGTAKFGELETGTYLLAETKAPDNYELDNRKHVVTITEDHTVTIDGLVKNELGFFEFPNDRQLEGKIKITKVWQDGKTDDERETPVVHITNDENIGGDLPYATLRQYGLSLWNKKYVTGFEKTTEHLTLSEVLNKEGVERVDDYTTSYSIYVWPSVAESNQDKVLYWWTNAEKVFLPADSTQLFYEYNKITSLDLTDWDTSRVTNMREIVAYCKGITSLNVSNWDVSNVTSMGGLFQGLNKLTELDVSRWNVSNVKSISGAFCFCSNLTKLDLNNWDVSSVTSFSGAFQFCYKLEELYINDWDTSNAISFDRMFEECKALKVLDVSKWDVSKATGMEATFEYCTALESLDVSKWNVENVTNFAYAFYGCSSLQSLDVSKWNVGKATNTAGMFNGCGQLTSLDVSKWDVSNVTTLQSTFSGCSGLTGLDVSEWDVSSVASLGLTFYGCRSLTGLDVSKWDVSSVTSLDSTFYGCSSLTGLDVSKWDVSSVTSLKSTFGNCTGLTELDISKWDVSSVTSLEATFYGCRSLTELDISKWDVSNVTTLQSTFSGCSGLTSLAVGDWDISVVTNCYQTFSGCKEITTLELGNWSLKSIAPKVYYYDRKGLIGMFQNCTKLKTIFAPEDMDLSYIDQSSSADMFSGCSSLTGGYGTIVTLVTSEYARVDSAGAPGYFTKSTLEPKPVELIPTLCSDFRNLFYKASGNAQNNVVAFKRDTEKTLAEVQALTDVNLTRVDAESNSQYVYIWGDGIGTSEVTIYWWCSTDEVYLMPDCAYLFNSYNNIREIDTNGWNTSKVVSLIGAFDGCKKLTTLDVSGWDISHVSSLERVFCECSSLTTLDVSNWNVGRVSSFYRTFYNCSSLTTLDVSNWNVGRVSSFYQTFYNCSSLTTLDVSNWNVGRVSTFYQTFYRCSKLTALNAGNWNTSRVNTFESAFYECYLLAALETDNWDTSKVTTFYQTFYRCSKLTALNTSNWDISSANSLSSMFYGCSSLSALDVSKWDISSAYSLSMMFYRCSSLSALDVSKWDLSNVTNIGSMFDGCSSLSALDVSEWDLSNVTYIGSMFDGCNNLTTLDVSKWDLKNNTSLDATFWNCYNLTTLDVSKWDVSNVTSCYQTFNGCSKVTTLDVSKWDTKKVTDMTEMFNGCYNLTALDVSKWEVGKVKSLESTFYSCRQLTTLDVSKWDVSEVTNLICTFAYCNKLERLDLSKWNLKHLQYVSATFNCCNKLKQLDLSSWDTSKVVNRYNANAFQSMFYYCQELEKIYASESFVYTSLSSMSGTRYMFYGCGKLVGGNGTRYDSSHTDGTYGRIDKAGQPGYFTFKGSDVGKIYTSEDSKWVKNGDNTWTYVFEVFDDEARFSFWEDELQGYQSDGYISSDRKINDGEITKALTVKNWTESPPPDPEYGALKVSKTVVGDQLVRDETLGYIPGDFSFTLTLTGNEIAGTQVFGSHVFRDGVATFILHDGQSALFTDIPAGVGYLVEETPVDNFTTTYDKNNGVIVANSTEEVNFTNTWNDTSPKNSFVLAKKVINGSADDKFDFSVMLTGLYPKFTYRLSNGKLFASDSNGDATVTVSLNDNGRVTFLDLPIGAGYRVTEAASGYIASYAVADANNLMLIKSGNGANDKSDTALSTAFETVDLGEDVTVTFTNEKESPPPVIEFTQREVKKIWVGDNATDRPESIIVYLYQNDDMLKAASLTARNNWETVFDKLPLKDEFGAEYRYRVVEGSVNGYTGTYAQTGDVVTITNTKVPVGSATIRKTVDGEGADLNHAFRFTVGLTNASGEKITASFPYDGTHSGTIAFVDGEASVSLKHNEQLTVHQVPAGYLISVRESEVASYEITTPAAGSYENKTITANTTLDLPFVNHYDGTSDLSVEKHVYSSYTSDKSIKFRFEISLYKEDGAAVEGSFETEGTGIDSLTFADGKASFTLADSEKLIIKSLPVGARYEIRETDTGGVQFNTFSTNEKGVILRDADDNYVVFSNQRFTLPETGGSGEVAVGVVVAAISAVLAGAFLIFAAVRKRKKSYNRSNKP